MCETFHAILLPVFETSNMVTKKDGKRRLRAKSVRSLLTWSHFRFRQRLQAKCREYPHCEVVLVTEEYTSQTCGQCGALHTKLGASKLFTCPQCAFSMDRDVNAARNILLKYVTEQGLPHSRSSP